MILVTTACGGGAGQAPTSAVVPTQAAAPTNLPQPTTEPPTTAPQPTEAPTQAPTAGSGGTLRIGLDVDAGTGDPRLMRDTSAFRLRELVFDGLVDLKPDFTPAPALAENWENPDDKTWVFHLRKGVMFNNGQELKASDVKYTFDTILDANFKSPSRSFFTPVKSVDVVDDYTVKFTLDSAYAPSLSYLTMSIVPQAVVEKDPT